VKRKVGRPRKVIDWSQAEKLASLHCTGEEIASFLEVDYDTLNSAIKREFDCNFSEWYKKNSAKGKISLRRKQFEQALSGNTSLLIWLGKQWLGQTDKIENDSGTQINIDADFFSNLKNNNNDNKNDE
jgi:hypothetical protein